MFSRSSEKGSSSNSNQLKRKGAVKRRGSAPDPEEVAGHLRRLSQDFTRQLQQLSLASPPTPSPPPPHSPLPKTSMSTTKDSMTETVTQDTEGAGSSGSVDESRRDSRRDSDQVVVVNEESLNEGDDNDVTVTEGGSQSESIELSGIDDPLSGSISSGGLLPSGSMKLVTSTGLKIDLKPIIDARIQELNRPLSTLTIMTEDESGNIQMTTSEVHDDKEVTTIITENVDPMSESNSHPLQEGGFDDDDIDEEKEETLEEALRDPALNESLRRRSLTACERLNKFRPFYGYGSDEEDDDKYVPVIQPLRAVDALKLPSKLEGDTNSTDTENIEDDD